MAFLNEVGLQTFWGICKTWFANKLGIQPSPDKVRISIKAKEGLTEELELSYGNIPAATSTAAGVMTAADKSKLNGIATGATANIGTITKVIADSPISGGGDSGIVHVSHQDSGVTDGTYGTISSIAINPDFGETFNVPGYTVDTKGHITQAGNHTVKIPNSSATSSSSGLMSASDKAKLDGIEAGATADTDAIKTVTSTTPIITHVSNNSLQISHDLVGSEITAGDISTSQISPAFGQTFKVPGFKRNSTGHVIEATEHNVKIPNAVATTSTPGLMSASDKAKLNSVEENATANIGTITSVTTVTPLSGSGDTGGVILRHVNSGVTPNEYGEIDTDALTPAFGQTFKVPGFRVDATGHVTEAGTHTIKIPNNVATSSSPGLLSSSDKVKLNSYPVTGSSTDKFLRNDGTWVKPEDTQYTSGTGISVSNDHKITNTGVVSISTGTTDGSLSVKVGDNQARDILVAGLGSAAFSDIGVAGGIPELDANGKVPSSQLPSYVDDVLEFSSVSSFPQIGESGKIYVDTSTNITYRWGGTQYVEISQGLALGETEDTAYRGDRGAYAYTHASDSSKLSTAKSLGFYKLSATSQGHIATLTPVVKADITALGIPGSDTHYTITTENIGSASVGNLIAIDDILGWSAGTASKAIVDDGVLVLSNSTVPSLEYTSRTIPDISVTTKQVVTNVTAS